jgi:hypothetical protein
LLISPTVEAWVFIKFVAIIKLDIDGAFSPGGTEKQSGAAVKV